ncbi:MAG: hypothetical protein QOK14_1894, partial [Frankiaceae bacterium]|nr:hypothetical protein [Frankiaceae bacterium]
MAQPDGFDEFVALRGADLRRLAFLLTSDRREAEELVESTLARCLAGWRRLEQEQDPFEYARGVLFQHGAPRRRRLATLLADALPHHARNRREAAEPPTGGSDDGDAGELTGDEDRQELLCGLSGLRGIERKVVVLRLVEGLSEPETATVLRRSPAAVRRHGDAAVRRIREAAAGAGTGPPDRGQRPRRRLRARPHYQAAAPGVVNAR